jgi:hypothetical protein
MTVTGKEPTSLKEPIEILLRVLLAGNTVTDANGQEYGMDEDGHLCIKANRPHPKYSPNKDPEPIWLQVPCDISELKVIADRIGRDTLWLKACGIPLRSLI